MAVSGKCTHEMVCCGMYRDISGLLAHIGRKKRPCSLVSFSNRVEFVYGVFKKNDNRVNDYFGSTGCISAC